MTVAEALRPGRGLSMRWRGEIKRVRSYELAFTFVLVITNILVSACPAEAQSQPTQDILRIDTDLVTTLFTALDRQRRFVTNLQAEDLKIFEDGIEQEIAFFEQETSRPLTLVIVADLSKSQERTLAEQKRAATVFLNSVISAEKDNVALVSFTGRPKLEQPFTDDLKSLSEAINWLEIYFPPTNPLCEEYRPVEVEYHCWSSIWDAVSATSNILLARTPESLRRAIVLLSDGDDSSSMITLDEAAESALKHNATIFSIGIGDPKRYRIDRSALRRLSERTGGRAFFPRDEAQLQAAFAQIQQEMRSQYVIAYSPKNRLRDGSYRQVKIEVVNPQQRRRRLQLFYRHGYYARKDTEASRNHHEDTEARSP